MPGAKKIQYSGPSGQYYRTAYAQESGWGKRIGAMTEDRPPAHRPEPKPEPRPVRETITPLELRAMALVYFVLGALCMWLFGC